MSSQARGDQTAAPAGTALLPMGPAVSTVSASPDASSRARGALVRRARDGDQSAFDELLGWWLEPSFRTALAILGDESDARDATQDAFVAAWRQLRQLRDPERFDAWFGRILVNSCRAVRRARRRAVVREISMFNLPERDEPASADDPADEQVSCDDAIERAFGRLDVADRTILVLHHLDRRPLAAIATALDIPVGTVKSRLFKARRSLEHALEAER